MIQVQSEDSVWCVLSRNRELVLAELPVFQAVDSGDQPKTLNIPGPLSFAGLVPITYDYYTTGAHIGKLEHISQGPTRTYTFGYDSNGYLNSVTDPLTRTTTFTNDAVGRVLSQELPHDVADPGDHTIGMSYDANSNVTSIEPPGQPAHTFGYTPVNLEQSYDPPLPEPGYSGEKDTGYTYNLDKQLDAVDRPGIHQPSERDISLEYDESGDNPTGFLTSITIPRGQINFTYETSTGYVDTMTAPGGESLDFTYTGSFLTNTSFSGTVTGNVSRTYDNNFRLESQSINSGNTINYTYDNDGLLTGAGDLTLQRDLTNGLITGTTLGSITDTIGYTDAIEAINYGEVASYSAQTTTDPLYAVTYERDFLGRITKKTETLEGGTPVVFEYTYYTRSWLHEVIKDGVTISTYTYDENGNRLSHETQSGTTSATYDDQDRLSTYGDTTFTFTDNGELLTKTDSSGTTSYTYDSLGNLSNVTLPDGPFIEYIIDAANRRIGKKVNGTITQKFLYDSQLHPLAELDASNNIVSIFGPGYMIKNGVTYRFITDHLGSTRMVVNKDTGVIEQQIDYDEYGNVINDTNPGFQPFGFAGGLYDADAGLVRFGARDYDPSVGRWTVKGPIGFRGGDTALYGYCFNDPVNWVDLLVLKGKTYFRLFTRYTDQEGMSSEEIEAERAHEAQHRADFWRFDLESWQLEQRAFKAEAESLEKSIIRLMNLMILSNCPDEKKELQNKIDQLKTPMQTADSISRSEWEAKYYVKNAQ